MEIDDMTLTIELTPDQEARLAEFAQREGLDPAAMAQRLVTEHLPSLSGDNERIRRELVMRELVEETERLGLY